MTPEQETQIVEAYYSNHWSKLIRGASVMRRTFERNGDAK